MYKCTAAASRSYIYTVYLALLLLRTYTRAFSSTYDASIEKEEEDP